MVERSQRLINKIRNSLLNQQQSTRDCLEIKTNGGAGGDGQKGYQYCKELGCFQYRLSIDCIFVALNMQKAGRCRATGHL